MLTDIIKIFVPLTVSFFVGIALAPVLTHYLYKHKAWKKRSGKVDPSGNATPIFNQLHAHKEVGTPRMGGIIIWASVVITVLVIWLFSLFFPSDWSIKLNFLSRNQTWLPFAVLIFSSLVGLLDDWLEVRGNGNYVAGGLAFRQRALIVLAIGLVIAWWLVAKLGINAILIPFIGPGWVGVWLVPIVLVVLLGLFSSGVIDGLDGLAGGVMAIIFATYAVIAFFQHQIDLATFCAVITGGILAFLWFNIPPARFYMSETGILGLTTTLTIVAFLTDAVVVLPIIALPLVVTSLSVAMQLSSKKFLGRKVFLVAPLHHHFEAKGWPAHKVVMRYWVISIISAVIGMVVFFAGR